MVDVGETCAEAFAYLPDIVTNGLVVYSLKDDESWRVSHLYFHFDPLAGNYSVGGVSFQWTDGIFGLSLANKQADGKVQHIIITPNAL